MKDKERCELRKLRSSLVETFTKKIYIVGPHRCFVF